MGMLHGYVPKNAANSSCMEVCDQAPLRLFKMWDLKLLTLSGRLFSKWGREGVAYSFVYKGGQYLIHDYL
jgi:hypothetical protein